jgi:hypothetical protein
MGFAREHRARARASVQPAAGKARARPSLRAHPAFAPLLGLWGAAVGGIIVMVLPSSLLDILANALPADIAPRADRATVACAAALLVALITYATARGLRQRTGTVGNRVRPIDPVTDFGVESLDAPLPGGLFAGSNAWLPDQPADEMLAREAAAELAAVRAEAAVKPPPPRELDLAEFAVLPGRNAVWVEESVAAISTVDAPAAVPAALAKLRAVPPGELSLCQMVERFAAALQDYQAGQPGPAMASEAAAQREAVLDEALTALANITRTGLADIAEQHGAHASGVPLATKRKAG